MFGPSTFCCQHPLISEPLDLGVGAIAFIFAIYGLIAFAIVVPIEALMLRLLQWNSFPRSFLDAFLVNAASSVVGVALIAILGTSRTFYQSPISEIIDLFSIQFWIVSFLLTVLLEAMLLAMIRRKINTEVVRNAFLINLASYLGLILLLLVLGL